MQYLEVLPDDIFSNHIESYWQVAFPLASIDQEVELLLPTCTFNVIFTDKPCLVRSRADSTWETFLPGGAFFGQRSKCITLRSSTAIKLYGIRFKPFAFSTINSVPKYQLNDEITKLEDIFELGKTSKSLIQDLQGEKLTSKKMELLNDLMYLFLKDSLSVDEKLRAQLNYIMDRKGSLKISDLFTEFSTSKVTLRKHFIEKVGLTPKKVSQIWRMNYLLQLQAESPTSSLTSLCLKAGFYDQAHFIKNFKQLFDVAPKKFFTQKNELLQLANHNISRRFGNLYDPK